MPTKDRQRALARAKLERQMARRAAAARRRRQIQAAIGAAVALAAVIAGSVYLVTTLGGDDEKSSTANAASKNPSCAYLPPAPGQSDPKTTKDVGTPPTENVPRTGTRTATLTTNLGPIEIALDQAKAPCTVNSFVYLANKKFFDKTSCHRLTTQGLYVLQCGDPSGTGTGGPAYKFGVENLPKGLHPSYPAGTVAMANSNSPDSNGSQFFIVYKDTELPANYTIFGTVTKGLDLVQQVAAKGVTPRDPKQPGDGAPKQKVTITSVTIGPTAEG